MKGKTAKWRLNPFIGVYVRLFLVYEIKNHNHKKDYIGQTSNGSDWIHEHWSGLLNQSKNTNIELSQDFADIQASGENPLKYFEFIVHESHSIAGKCDPRVFNLWVIKFKIKEIQRIQAARAAGRLIYNMDPDDLLRSRLTDLETEAKFLQDKINKNPNLTAAELESFFHQNFDENTDSNESTPTPHFNSGRVPTNAWACSIEGQEFSSVSDAARKLKRDPGVIRDWLAPTNMGWPDWFYLDLPESERKVKSFQLKPPVNASRPIWVEGERFSSIRNAYFSFKEKGKTISQEMIKKHCEDQNPQWKDWYFED